MLLQAAAVVAAKSFPLQSLCLRCHKSARLRRLPRASPHPTLINTSVCSACLLLVSQLTFLDEQLPYLTGTARAALRGMDRKPISDLVA